MSNWITAIIVLFFGEVVMNNEKEIMRRCAVRGWAYNTFTAYLLETNRSAGRVAVLMGASLATTNYWLYQEHLAAAVQFLFLIARKLRQSRGIDILDMV